jgi:hypothetical protein
LCGAPANVFTVASSSEFVIGGWLPSPGPNRQTAGALLLEAHCRNGLLQFCGVVGTGFTARHRRKAISASDCRFSIAPGDAGRSIQALVDPLADARAARRNRLRDSCYRSRSTLDEGACEYSYRVVAGEGDVDEVAVKADR